MSVAAQDHYLIAWAVTSGGGKWQSWEAPWISLPFDEGYGQFNFGGTAFVTRLSKMGVPVVTSPMRECILEALAAARMAGASAETAHAG